MLDILILISFMITFMNMKIYNTNQDDLTTYKQAETC